MDTIMDSKFVEKSEAIVTQFGFKDLKSFIKSQTFLMIIARIDKFEAEARKFEAKYSMDFKTFETNIKGLKNKEDFKKEEDYMDWRFSREALDRLKKQKQELEYA